MKNNPMLWKTYRNKQKLRKVKHFTKTIVVDYDVYDIMGRSVHRLLESDWCGMGA